VRGGLGVPGSELAGHVQHVGGRERGALDEPQLLEPRGAQEAWRLSAYAAGELRSGQRTIPQGAEDVSLAVTDRGLLRIRPQDEEVEHRWRRTVREEGRVDRLQRLGGPRVLVAQVRQRDDPARADLEAAVDGEAHVAVAAQACGGDVRGLDTRQPSTHTSPLRADAHEPLADDGRVGGGPAHVEDDGILDAGEVLGPGDAGRRAGEHRLDRSLQRGLAVDQRPVALDHRQRRLDATAFQGHADGVDQPPDHRQQAPVEDRGIRPADEVETARKLVPADDGELRAGADGLHHLQLVGGVLDPRIAGDREGVDARRNELLHRRGHLDGVDRLELGAVDGQAPAHEAHVGPLDVRGRRQPGSQDDGSRYAAFALDNRVGGQGRGERHEPDLRGIGNAQTIERLLDADQQIMGRGESLGLGDQLASAQVIQDAVGVGAAGVDAQADDLEGLVGPLSLRDREGSTRGGRLHRLLRRRLRGWSRDVDGGEDAVIPGEDAALAGAEDEDRVILELAGEELAQQ